MQTEHDTMVKLSDVARELGLSFWTVLKWARTGRLPGAVKTAGAYWRVPGPEVERLKREGTLTPAGAQ